MVRRKLDNDDFDDPGVLQEAEMRLRAEGFDELADELISLVREQSQELAHMRAARASDAEEILRLTKGS